MGEMRDHGGAEQPAPPLQGGSTTGDHEQREKQKKVGVSKQQDRCLILASGQVRDTERVLYLLQAFSALARTARKSPSIFIAPLAVFLVLTGIGVAVTCYSAGQASRDMRVRAWSWDPRILTSQIRLVHYCHGPA